MLFNLNSQLISLSFNVKEVPLIYSKIELNSDNFLLLFFTKIISFSSLPSSSELFETTGFL